MNPGSPFAIHPMVVRTFLVFSTMAGLAPSAVYGQTNTPPTYAEHIAPIINDRCVSCHRPGGMGPFSLLNYADVFRRADRIVKATSSQVMPPWLPDAGYRAFVGERRLNEEEIAIIQDWVITGRLVGDTTVVQVPTFQETPWQLGTPDLVVSVPPLELQPHAGDVYRNLVVSVPVQERRYIKSVELRPGGTNVVHHARMMIDTSSSSRELADADPGPGFDGMDLVSQAHNPDGFFVGWTPGKVPFQNPNGMATTGWMAPAVLTSLIPARAMTP